MKKIFSTANEPAIFSILHLEKTQLSILFFLCLCTFFLRSYGLYRDLFFAYDQGRDAWEMQKIARGDLTLIGPVTGLDGVFLGPFWYYLIFPAYFLGNGNPVASAYEMILFSVGTVIMLYVWGKKLSMPLAGLIAGAIYTFSFQQILFARWVANPTPLPFFSLLAFYMLFLALESKKKLFFVFTGVILGLCFQLEAANAFWFIPTIACIIVTQTLINRSGPTKSVRRTLLSREFYLSVISLGLLLGIGFSLAELPHIAFELKHDFLITHNAITALQVTRDVTLIQSIPKRIPLLFTLYGRGLFEKGYAGFAAVGIVMLFTFLRLRKYLWSSLGTRILALWFVIPLFFHIIFTGNHGNFWDYYVIAQHPVLYLLLGISMVALYRAYASKRTLIIIYCTCILLLSVGINIAKWTEIIHPYENRYSLDMMVKEANWMIDQADGRKYGVWVYTPSAQDDAHRYIYWWVGSQRHVFPEEHVEQQPLIFLAVEEDSQFQKRHDEWIQDKLSFGRLIAQQKFGAITVYEIENTKLFKPTQKSVR
jgi:4-amino-4-deoxy-L-arabinose transferase-like glycosyltransferase